MTRPLSPAAEVVLDAACTLADLLNREVSQDEMIAAALRALADLPVMWMNKDYILDIAAELEKQQ